MWNKRFFVFLGLALFLAPVTFYAQQRVSVNEARAKKLAPKDTTLTMSCLLNQAVTHQADRKNSMYDTEELKLILSSPTDTLVKACADAVISTVQRESDGTYEIVFYHNDFWFWLSGVSKVFVKPRQNVKNGQPLGMVTPNAKIELLLFNFETPVDPLNYLKCVD